MKEDRNGRPPVPQDTIAVREGFLAHRPDSVEAVRRWIASVVFGGGWWLSDPEAAIQEVALRLLNLARTGRIRKDADFRAFVMTVTRHTCTDIYRGERLRQRPEDPFIDPDTVRAEQESPEGQAEHRERIELLRYIIQALPEECRRLWRLVYAEELDAAQVAERIGISQNNARVRIHRCLKRAREIRRDWMAGSAAEGGEG